MSAEFTEEYLKAYYEHGGKKDYVVISNIYDHYISTCAEFSDKKKKITPLKLNALGVRVRKVFDNVTKTCIRSNEIGKTHISAYKGIKRRDRALSIANIGGFWTCNTTRTIDDNKYSNKKINPELVRSEFLKVYGELEIQLSKSTEEKERRQIVSDMADILDKMAKLCGAYKDDNENAAKMNHLDNIMNSNHAIDKNVRLILDGLCKVNPNG